MRATQLCVAASRRSPHSLGAELIAEIGNLTNAKGQNSRRVFAHHATCAG